MCKLPYPCPDAFAYSYPAFVINRSAAECIANALAERTIGSYRLAIDSGSPFGMSSMITVTASEHAFGTDSVRRDLSGTTKLFGRHRLKPKEYFLDCLTAPSDEHLYHCLTNWRGECSPGPGECTIE